ncbi:MAG: alpha-1,2-fucosyltransferase [Prevotella sp.]|nr:alpha-1,2-fucosyltransferase [Prevotella sp.]
MRIVKVIGGLGNQMFQFALYKALQRQFPEERVLLDLHCFNGYHKHRGFEIPKIFDVTYEEANWKEVAKVAYPYPNFQTWRFGSRILPDRKTMLKEKADYAFEPTAMTRKGDTYYDGYWQHEEYFLDYREDVLRTYTFPAFEDERNRETARLIANKNSCAIHIRRGDYVRDKLFRDICDLDYYQTAILRMKGAAIPDLFCVFSDDASWCREHISPLLGQTEAIYVDWNTDGNSFHDMHLMSLCRHQIIANSSFSWWGAWLNTNKEKVVIAPRKWWNISGAHTPISNSWIII